jgi:tetratricopeptide (TPR) repeat protein
MMSGDLRGAEEHFARMSDFFEAVGWQQFPGTVVVSALGVASLVAGILGHADSARERIARALAFGCDTKNPFDLAFARFWEGWLYRALREPQRAGVAATQALAICAEHGFPYVRDGANTIMGWSRAQLGSTGGGVALIREGLAGMAEIGARVAMSVFLKCLAEAQALDVKIDDALGTIEDALQANPKELFYLPDILSFRGELRLKLGQTELAESDFCEAIALAQKMQAKAWELRATMSLARLLDKQGRRTEARTMLGEIYNWFTEGFDTADLIDAKALLEELQARPILGEQR